MHSKLKKTFKILFSALLIITVGLAALIIPSGCRALFPADVTGEQRMAVFPTDNLKLEKPVRIYWNEYQVPFIEAETDEDLAYALGLIHSHLRSAQMAFLKRVSQGRISEMAGPIAAPLDQALRTLDLGYSAKAMVAALDVETRTYLEHYVQGLNDALKQQRKKPPESGLLGLKPEPFTLEDILTFGRLAGTDVNWLAYAGLMASRNSPEWELVWNRALEQGAESTPSFQDNQTFEQLLAFLGQLSRSGSNSIVIGPELTVDGKAAIANDPHLGTYVPNFWILIGMKSPSYHGVGAMIPGLPFMAYGRTPYIAWGGTNMRSASSDLFDISNLSPEDQAIQTREERIKIRLWKDRTVNIRRSAYGPIMSDLPFFPKNGDETVALRWVGHEISNEVGAFLSASRARSISEFVESFRNYAVSGQNLLLADNEGNIAMTLATRLPVREYASPPNLVLDASDPDLHWKGFKSAPELPLAFNPPEGFIASANNKPVDSQPAIGFLFAPPERIDRINQIMETAENIDLKFLTNLQQDVTSPSAIKLQQDWIKLFDEYEISVESFPVLKAIDEWDGAYHRDSQGPVAFELFNYHIINNLPESFPSGFSFRNWPYMTQYLIKDLKAFAEDQIPSMLEAAIAGAEADFEKYATWGDLHYQQAGHFLSNVPAIGGRFVYDKFPANGSRDTLYKTAHTTSNEPMGTTYGAQARHISLMGDLDENYFVLFGGQDGWLGSEHLIDQIALWKKGEYMRLPLRLESVQKEFKTVIELVPNSNGTR
jgi:penicillin amidase